MRALDVHGPGAACCRRAEEGLVISKPIAVYESGSVIVDVPTAGADHIREAGPVPPVVNAAAVGVQCRILTRRGHHDTVFLPGSGSCRVSGNPHFLYLFLKRIGVVFSSALNVRVNWLWS